MIDTSGSMDDKELMKGLGIVYDLAVSTNVNKISVLQHDFVLQSYEEFEVDMLSSPEDIVKTIRIKGRGGTSHVEPLKKYFKMIDSGEADEPDLLIIFSDFESDFEEAHKMLEQRGIDYVCISTYNNIDYIDKKKYPVIIIRD
jgi:predicted metal-dependent peptidase